MRFSADPAKADQVRGCLTRFTPLLLSNANLAAPGAITTVDRRMQGTKPSDSEVHQLSDPVKKIDAWSSTDGGRTWHAVTVKQVRGTWRATVHDPKSGTVALRSQVTDSHEDTTTTTVVDAYGVTKP
jgi:hypothetical protein